MTTVLPSNVSNPQVSLQEIEGVGRKGVIKLNFNEVSLLGTISHGKVIFLEK